MSRFERKRDFIVPIAFLRLKNTIETKEYILVAWRKRVHISGNHSQENHIFKPGRPQMTKKKTKDRTKVVCGWDPYHEGGLVKALRVPGTLVSPNFGNCLELL